MKKEQWALVVVLLWLFWGRVLVNIRDQSPTMDEPLHLIRGLAYWRAGDLRLQFEHPPLVHALSGLLLLAEPALPSPATLEGWEHGTCLDVAHALLQLPGLPLDRALFLGRWAVLALGMVLVTLVGHGTGELTGSWTAVAALFLITFDPNILAHSALLTTDLAVTCLMYGSCLAFFRLAARPTIGRAITTGLILGLALGTKLSALLLMLVPLLTLAREHRPRNLLLGLVVAPSVALFTLWAVYRFEVGIWPSLGIRLPLPTYWDNLLHLWQHQSFGQRAFFLGHVSNRGWWYYFPVLFLIKTPLSTLLLFGWALVRLSLRRECRLLMLLVLPLLYFALAMVSRINIGYRHILPVIPFIISIAATAFRPAGRSRPLLYLSSALALWLALSSLSVHPYYLAYFNEAVGGPERGYLYAVDSNLDWGQDLKRLKVYLDEREIKRVRLSYFGMARPEYYGIEYDPLPMPPPAPPADFSPLNPEPGIYAISASNFWLLEEPDIFDWFRRRRPEDKVGYSIFIYDVPERVDGRWVGVCFAPVPAFEEDMVREWLGRTNLRFFYFDCRSAWVYPASAAPGWYIIPGETEGPTVVSAFLSPQDIIFQGHRTSQRLSLTVYLGTGADGGPAGVTPPYPLSTEPCFGNVACFMGYGVERGERLLLRSYWRVQGRPEVPLSVMAHLVDAQGVPLGVADGLGFPVENWQVGDVFIQTHVFPPLSGIPHFVHVGLYRIDTLEHLPLVEGGGDHLVLELPEYTIGNE